MCGMKYFLSHVEAVPGRQHEVVAVSRVKLDLRETHLRPGSRSREEGLRRCLGIGRVSVYSADPRAMQMPPILTLSGLFPLY